MSDDHPRTAFLGTMGGAMALNLAAAAAADGGHGDLSSTITSVTRTSGTTKGTS